MVMAAGIGKGLRPITELIPKPLIPIANRPLIEHFILNFQKIEIKEIIILVGYLNQKIKDYFAKKSTKTHNIKIIDAKNYEKGPLYTLDAIRNQNVEEDFILGPADLFFDPKILSNLIRFHKKGSISIAIDSSRPEKEGTKVFTYSESRLNLKNKILKIGKIAGFRNNILKKPGSSALAIPLIICTPKIFRYIDKCLANNQSKVISALNLYIEKSNPFNFIDLPKYNWFDVDSLSEILRVNKFAIDHNIVPKNNIRIMNNGTISNLLNRKTDNIHSTTKIISPTLIGKNCHIDKNTQIGPYVSLNDNSVLGANCVIRNSIISGGADVPENSNFKNSIFFHNILIKVNSN
ncbi:MAG: sugar phosphate nucleotidyltransferase [Candidatus Helarchaeota archaeon]